VTRQGCTPALPLKAKSTVEEKSGLVQSMHAGAPGGEFKRQCKSVELATDLGNERCICIRQSKGWRARRHILHKTAGGWKRDGFICAEMNALWRGFQGWKSIHMLALNTQGLAACGQQTNAGGLLKETFGQICHSLNNMFAAVEDKKQPSLSEKMDQVSRRIFRLYHQAECGGERTRYQIGANQRPEIQEENIAAESTPLSMSNSDCNCRLADPARAMQGQESLCCKQGGDVRDLRLTTDDWGAGLGELGGDAKLDVFRPWLQASWGDGSNKAVTATRHVGDISVAVCAVINDASQIADMYPQAAFFDGNVRPDSSDQLLLGDDFPWPLKECSKDVESAPPDLNRHPVPLQKSLGEVQAEWPESHNISGGLGVSTHTIINSSPLDSG